MKVSNALAVDNCRRERRREKERRERARLRYVKTNLTLNTTSALIIFSLVGSDISNTRKISSTVNQGAPAEERAGPFTPFIPPPDDPLRAAARSRRSPLPFFIIRTS
ncbi:hypothetical protein PUN28_016174 [Cardiocondyla obscurior]|uniref:Uncharacterized protein n=1 Tax=Cardiocondyla obscurior TaxID=286306 RepID=A0AAW2ETS9_9HYME